MRRSTERLLVVAAAIFAWLPAVFGDFVYDDLHSVRDNEALRSLARLPSFLWDLDAFSAMEARMYRPVLLASFALEHALAGGAAWAYKLTDVAIHVACALLLASLVRALRGGRGPALVAGLLFAVHPLASEAVNMVSSRSDQMLAFGILLAMRCHVNAMAGSRRAVAVTALATALACGCKETGVVVPVLLLALEAIRSKPAVASWRGVDLRAAALRVAPSVLVAIGYLAVRKALFGVATVAAPAVASNLDASTGAGRGIVTQLDAMGQVVPRFLVQTFAPFGLTLDPHVPFHDELSWPALAGWVAIGILTYFGLRAPRRRPLAFAGTAVAWAAALPWVLIPLNAPAGEHRVYASLAGIGLCLAAMLPRDVLRRGTARGGLIAVLMLFAALSAWRSAQYADPEVLWRATLRSNPASAAAHASLAQIHRDRAAVAASRGDVATAEREMWRAIASIDQAHAIAPRHVPYHKAAIRLRLALGAEHGRPAVALVLAERLLERRPKDPILRILVAQAAIVTGHATGQARFFADGERTALSCLDVAEPKGLVFRVAAEARAAGGDLDGALEHLDESLARGLDHVSVRVDRASVLLQLGRREEARTELATVLAEDPFEPSARRLLTELSAAAPGR